MAWPSRRYPVTSSNSISPTPGKLSGKWAQQQQHQACKLTWADVNEARHWARTQGWGETLDEQVRWINSRPGFAKLNNITVRQMLLNEAWVDLNYHRDEPVIGTIDAATQSTPAFLAWILMWFLLVRRLTGGISLPPGLGGSTYYETAR